MTITDHLRVLFATFPAPQGDVAAQMQAISMALKGFTEDDVADAVEAFVQGRVPGHNMAFAPTAPQLASACRRAMELRLDEANRHRRAVLQIEAREQDTPKNAENRARVAAMVAGALKNLSMHDIPKAADNEATRAAYLKRHDERFHGTQYTVGDEDAEGDMGGRKAG